MMESMKTEISSSMKENMRKVMVDGVTTPQMLPLISMAAAAVATLVTVAGTILIGVTDGTDPLGAGAMVTLTGAGAPDGGVMVVFTIHGTVAIMAHITEDITELTTEMPTPTMPIEADETQIMPPEDRATTPIVAASQTEALMLDQKWHVDRPELQIITAV